MGYAKEKYTRAYFLRQDDQGRPTAYGVIGLEEFEQGGIRSQDRALLAPLCFNGKSVIEFGFGRGEAIKYALEQGAQRVIGVDFSAEAVAIAREFLQRHQLEAELFCADALEFVRGQKSAGRFDFLLLLDVIEHIPRGELKTLLTEMHRLLQPKAVLVINTPVFGTDNDVLAEGLKPRARDESDDFPETAGMHCNRYTKSSLRGFLRECGYGAIGGHFFINRSAGVAPARFARHTWKEAFQNGYPLATACPPREHFDFAFSSKQQARLRRLYSANKMVKALGLRLLPILWRLGLISG